MRVWPPSPGRPPPRVPPAPEHQTSAWLPNRGLRRRRRRRAGNGDWHQRHRVRRQQQGRQRVRPAGHQRRPSGRPCGHRLPAVSPPLPGSRSTMAPCTSVRSVASTVSTTSSARSTRLPSRWSSTTRSRASSITAGSSSRSVRTACCTCPSERHATSASGRAATAIIARMKPDGSGLETFASGVRNSVGFDWHPVTKELWFTDNGRDLLGDDIPPDELNHAPRIGLHFGFPYCSCRRHQGSRIRRQATVLGVRAARAEARAARCVHRHAVLHRKNVSGGVSQPDLHRRAWLVEPQHADRLPRERGEARTARARS